MKITAIASWHGSNRSLAAEVGRRLAGARFVAVPFAGGMSELAHITARTLLVSDLHRHVINLARVVQTDRERLQAYLAGVLFHPDALAEAQARCRAVEAGPDSADRFQWAADYFVCAWMARNGTAGTAREFEAGLSVRYDAGGGDSAVRFRSAAESLAAWQTVVRRCTFHCRDGFEVLADVADAADSGVYCDPPFPGAGRRYRHNAGAAVAAELVWHTRLRDALARFARARVVVRYYRHALVEQLYPAADGWHWDDLAGGKTQTNAAAPEVLLTRNLAS